MEIVKDRNKRESAMVTAVVAILLLLLLIFTGLTVPDPPIETGIEMSFGTSLQGQGDEQPEEVNVTEQEEVTEEVTESQPIPVDNVEEVHTQDAVETIAVPEETTNNEETEVVEEEPEQVVDQKALYPGSNSNNSNSSSQGETGDPGDQGSTDGGDNNNYTGTSGSGGGFNLGNRDILFRHVPENTTQETGTVVVNIWVDRYGKVKRATPGAKGSTTTNSTLYRIAKSAAMLAKFSANSKASEEQKGTITFEFKAGQ